MNNDPDQVGISAEGDGRKKSREEILELMRDGKAVFNTPGKKARLNTHLGLKE
jgi:hypothetical protein